MRGCENIYIYIFKSCVNLALPVSHICTYKLSFLVKECTLAFMQIREAFRSMQAMMENSANSFSNVALNAEMDCIYRGTIAGL